MFDVFKYTNFVRLFCLFKNQPLVHLLFVGIVFDEDKIIPTTEPINNNNNNTRKHHPTVLQNKHIIINKMTDIEEKTIIPGTSDDVPVLPQLNTTEDDTLSIVEVLSVLPSNRPQLSLLDIYIIIINIVSINITVLCFSTKDATLSYYCCSYLLSVSFVLILLSKPKEEVVKNSSIASFILASILFTGLLPYNYFFLLFSNERYDQYIKNVIGIAQAALSIGCIFTIPQKYEKVIALAQIIVSVTFPYDTHFHDKLNILGNMELQVNLFVIIWYFELFTSYFLIENNQNKPQINTKKLVIISIPVLRLKGFLYILYSVFYLSAHGVLVFKHLKKQRKENPELFKVSYNNNNNHRDDDDDDDDFLPLLDEEPKRSPLPPVHPSLPRLFSRKKNRTVKFVDEVQSDKKISVKKNKQQQPEPSKKTKKEKIKKQKKEQEQEEEEEQEEQEKEEPKQPNHIDFDISHYIVDIPPPPEDV